ncbi:MAG: DUF3307 domain-containing protein [Patescibacteria group bacterium]|nr:DUF3307 domain-containing protein [Patescibacteria group bacterium]
MGLLLGHMAGDYLLQNQWMALNKSRRASWLPGFVHACLYTAAVLLLTWDFHWAWAAVIFASHWPVDRWSWGEKWLHLIGGRTLGGYLDKGHEGLEVEGFKALGINDFSAGLRPFLTQRDIMRINEERLSNQQDNLKVLRGSFHSLVYAAADNTIHLLLMWGGWHLLRAL